MEVETLITQEEKVNIRCSLPQAVSEVNALKENLSLVFRRAAVVLNVCKLLGDTSFEMRFKVFEVLREMEGAGETWDSERMP